MTESTGLLPDVSCFESGLPSAVGSLVEPCLELGQVALGVSFSTLFLHT